MTSKVSTPRSIMIAAAVISGFAVAENLMAASCPSEVIVYQARGTFGPNVVSGPDKFKLADEPFSIGISVCASKTPTKTGADYSAYSPLVLTGSVTSGLTGQPTTIGSQDTSLTLVKPTTGLDTVQLTGVVVFEGADISITGSIGLPSGTLTTTSIAPFPKTQTVSGKSDFTYVVTHPAWTASKLDALGNEILDSNGNIEEVTTPGTSGTTAPVWNKTVGGTTTDNTVVWTNEGPQQPTTLTVFGTVAATVETGSTAKAAAFLHSDAVQVITAHADGTQSVRPMQATPAYPEVETDRVMLRFYASGVSDASEVQVQIAGQDVRVLYSGASGQFPGLDDVSVELPRSLSGIGDADVVLTVDGETASPVRVHIQ
jgi:hypothetical protein